VLVIDDASEDQTAKAVEAIAQADPRVKLLHVDGPPPGWSGKCYALTVGAEAARGEWLLFTDADANHAPNALATVVDYASARGIGLLSLTGEQQALGLWERIIQPVVFGLLDQWYPLAKVNDPRSPLAAANGIFLLFRRDVYEAVGGHRGVAGEVLEDVALARAVKARGIPICFAPGQGLVAARMYRSVREIRNGWTKNLYLLLDRSASRVMIRGGELLLTGLVPLLSLIVMSVVAINGVGIPPLVVAVLSAGLTVTLMAEGLYRSRRGDDPLMAWSHPIGAACVLVFLLESTARYRLGLGVAWKGRVYREAISHQRSAVSS
jgi:GT2 family glycosyltransferase